MNSFKHLICASVLAALASTASASIVITISAGRLETQAGGAPIAAGSLLQLINLGPDGIFNPININDGTASGLERWVSGDDSVLNFQFVGTALQGADTQFPTTAAFDLRHSAVAENTAGRLSRVLDFTAPAGIKVGLRWFPSIQASQFGTFTLVGGEDYGQFTRQSNPLNAGIPWVIPADGAAETFDALATSFIGGPDPDTAGRASFDVVPEPGSLALAMIGAAGLAVLRRRRNA
jgi:hypothetical protein